MGSQIRGFCALALGGAIGTFAFLLLFAILAGTPIQDSIVSAHAILIPRDDRALSDVETTQLAQLLSRGLIMSPDAFLSSVNSFYTSIIQMLIILFGLFGLLSYFTIRARSSHEIEKLTDEKVHKSFDVLEGSEQFDRRLRQLTQNALTLELEDITNRLSSLENAATNWEEYLKNVAASDQVDE